MGSPNSQNADVAVQVFDEFVGLVCVSRLDAVCRAALEQEGVARQVSLVIADDDTVRALNAKYRGLDATTDVLSFGFDNQDEYYGEGDAPSEWSTDDSFVLPPGEAAELGEVIISYPQATRQARERGRSVEEELAHLVAHGVLHLIGHDHMSDAEELAMNSKERSIMARVMETERYG